MAWRTVDVVRTQATSAFGVRKKAMFTVALRASIRRTTQGPSAPKGGAAAGQPRGAGTETAACGGLADSEAAACGGAGTRTGAGGDDRLCRRRGFAMRSAGSPWRRLWR